MGDRSGANGAPGHFNNDTSRHTEVTNRRNNVEGLFLYNQQQPYTGEERPTVALQVNTVYGQARIVQVESRTVDAEAEGDGSVSIPYILPNINNAGQQEHNSEAVAAMQSLASPIDPVPVEQTVSSLLGVNRRAEDTSLTVGTLQDDINYHGQSCSGFSANINRLAPQLQELPSNDSSAVQLNRQENLAGACAQQTLCVLSDDHVEPMNIQAQQAVLIRLVGKKAFQDNRLKCLTSFIKAGSDRQTAEAYANQLLHCRDNGATVECLHCGCTARMANSFIHGQQCPVLKSLQKAQNNGNVTSASDGRQFGACGTNARENVQRSQTAYKKPEGQTSIPPPYPQQVSEATAIGHSGIVFPPSQQNQRHAAPTQVSPVTAGPSEEIIRAECAGDLNTAQERTETRITGNEGNASAGMRSSSSFQTLSVPQTSSSVYRTAPVDRTPQGGGDRELDRQRARHPGYADFQARFGTFCNFPTSVYQDVHSLADAGLFYTGKKDVCMCYHCGEEIHTWSQDDDPWFEHARFFPQCAFVIQQKGQEYINAIKRALNVAGRESQVQDSVTSGQNVGGNYYFKYSCKIMITDFLVDRLTTGEFVCPLLCRALQFLDRDVVQGVENMGYNRPEIVKAVEEYKRRVQTGRVSKLDDKMNAVLDILSEKPEVAKGDQRQISGNRFDYTLCCACKCEKASISQEKCGHIVCKGCAPPRYDQKQVPHCKFCGREVVGTNFIDTSFL